ncbi:alkylhydroperoxidase family enzyme [Mycolicibacterium sp. BK634]|uniref:carboxymuconolactone decarboxylase family protein n=1 Tax=Mycolicibacterium sp. BK634 TaxID=2587099 RepID=UPI001620DE60|nr:4-carboxymuconolactone decarboxylase [Mycolicibacterium sp. BK634]MBB3750920.1 alkylhydroperoxidase family enzyme [Mycolicibacterium sp. BK634]
MRLPLLAPDQLTPEQRALYDDISELVDAKFGDLPARSGDGALLGPFNGWLHHPQFGRAAWLFNRAMWEHSVLPDAIHQLVILVTAARFGARYETRGHEYFARRAALPDDVIAAIAAGERPANLSHEQAVAFSAAAVLNRGKRLPDSTYHAAVHAFGVDGAAEIVFLVGCFNMVGITLNAFDE